MPVKIPVSILVGLVALCASILALWGWNEAWTAQALANKQSSQVEALEGQIKGMQTRLRTVESNYATAELRLRQAWGSAPANRTPPAVVDELCKRGNCASVDALQAPSDRSRD